MLRSPPFCSQQPVLLWSYPVRLSGTKEGPHKGKTGCFVTSLFPWRTFGTEGFSCLFVCVYSACGFLLPGVAVLTFRHPHDLTPTQRKAMQTNVLRTNNSQPKLRRRQPTEPHKTLKTNKKNRSAHSSIGADDHPPNKRAVDTAVVRQRRSRPRLPGCMIRYVSSRFHPQGAAVDVHRDGKRVNRGTRPPSQAGGGAPLPWSPNIGPSWLLNTAVIAAKRGELLHKGTNRCGDGRGFGGSRRSKDRLHPKETVFFFQRQSFFPRTAIVPDFFVHLCTARDRLFTRK